MTQEKYKERGKDALVDGCVYLCKVKGLMFTDRIVLKWSGGRWWQYCTCIESFAGPIEGWFGIGKMRVVDWLLVKKPIEDSDSKLHVYV